MTDRSRHLPRDLIDEKIDALAKAMATLMRETDEASRIDAFAGLADEILEATCPEDQAHAFDRLQRVLADNGLVADVSEGCSRGTLDGPA